VPPAHHHEHVSNETLGPEPLEMTTTHGPVGRALTSDR
jgi:hypothetical protein